ncbi:MAG: hypothetical protein ABW250_26675, partial [Pyrinomonadaceae bacterium]
MLSVGLCLLAFAFSYAAGKRSLVAGLSVVFAVGYLYGILRANVPEPSSHFIFDAAVAGLYLTQLWRRPSGEERRSQQLLRLWVGLLVAWPVILFFVPVQSYPVQMVGLRGNVFLLPFLLLGGRLRDEEVYKLALWLGALNLLAAAFAGAEFFLGVERFYPRNEVTDLIYKSAVDDDFMNPERSTALRIPSTFTSAHAYAGMMVMSLAFLIGAWALPRERGRRERRLLYAAMAVSLVGVFAAAARSPVVILAAMLVTVFLSVRLRAHGWVFLLVMLAGVGWIVSSEARLQRFMTLQDVEFVGERVSWSVNDNFTQLLAEYPLGNGLGGGGTSMPYFLASEVSPPSTYMENEYARIVLEQGVLGLCLWVAFIGWLFTRRNIRRSDPWHVGRRLVWVACAAFFATGMIGKGLFTSIPGTALILLGAGWIAVRRSRWQGETAAGREPVEAAPAGGRPAL